MLLKCRLGRGKLHQLQSNAGWFGTLSVNLDELSGQSVAVTGRHENQTYFTHKC
jgi:hypothetical protein